MIKVLRLFFINTMVFVFLLLSLEIGLRIYLEKMQIFSSDSYKQDYPGLKNIVSHTIYKGKYRSKSAIDFSKKNDGTIRILCVGASTAEQITQNFSDTWCGLIGEKLQKKIHNINFETAIFATPGWLVIDNYLWAEKNLAASKPDIVISLFGINDLAWNGYPSYAYSSFDEKKKEWLNFRSTNDPDYLPDIENVTSKSYVDILIDIIKNRPGYSCILCERIHDIKRKIYNNRYGVIFDKNISAATIADRQALPLLTHIERNPDPIVEFNDAINAFSALSAHKGIHLIMLGQPTLWSETDPDPNDGLYWFTISYPDGTARLPSSELSKMMYKYNNLQKKSAESHGQFYIDLNNIIPKTTEYFIDECHFTDKGSTAVSEAIYPVIWKIVSETQNNSN